MNKIKIVILVFVLLLFSGYAQAENIWFSPLTGVAVGPSGPPSKLIVSPYCCPSTALKVTAAQTVTDSDSQWVILGLTAQEKKVIKGVQVCYQVITNSPGSTFISQTRLSSMSTPNSALVIHDDATNLTSIDPVCVTSLTKPKPKVTGTTTLELKMVIGNVGDEIIIGGVKLLF